MEEADAQLEPIDDLDVAGVRPLDEEGEEGLGDGAAVPHEVELLAEGGLAANSKDLAEPVGEVMGVRPAK